MATVLASLLTAPVAMAGNVPESSVVQQSDGSLLITLNYPDFNHDAVERVVLDDVKLGRTLSETFALNIQDAWKQLNGQPLVLPDFDGTFIDTDTGFQFTINRGDVHTNISGWLALIISSAVGFAAGIVTAVPCFGALESVTAVGGIVCPTFAGWAAGFVSNLMYQWLTRGTSETGLDYATAVEVGLVGALTAGGFSAFVVYVAPLIPGMFQAIAAAATGLGRSLAFWFGDSVLTPIVNWGKVAIRFGAWLLDRLVAAARDRGIPMPRTTNVRLMPLGDSITEGFQSSSGNGYRKGLYDDLIGRQSLGVGTLDFVGSQRDGTMPDPDNQGIGGLTISDVASTVTDRINTYQPNIVTLHLGTNDLDRNIDVGQAPARLNALVDQILGASPDVVVVVSTLVTSPDATMQAKVAAFNQDLVDLLGTRTDLDRRVFLSTADDLTASDFADTLHPNDSGYTKLAADFDTGVWGTLLTGQVVSSAVPPTPNGTGVDIAGIDANNDMKLYLGTGGGTLTGDSLMWSGGGAWAGFKAIAAGDFNTDGRVDIAGIDANNDMKLYEGTGAGTLTGGDLMWSGGGAWAGFKAITAGDFNGDGRIDIAGIDANNDMKFYEGTGAGELVGGDLMWPGGGAWAGFKAIAAGDFNGDGRVDIAGIDANNDMKLYTGTGNGTLTGDSLMWPGGGAWAGFKAITAGDFNGDGRIDIAGIDANNDMKLYTGTGNGTLTGDSLMWPGGGAWAGFTAIAAGDFNVGG